MTRRAPARVAVAPHSFDELAREVLDQRVEEAYARGLRDGEERAVQSAAGALERAARELSALAETSLAELGHEAVTLAVEIARHLLRAEIQAGRYDLETLVRETLAASGTGRGACVVHLNPKDAERLAGVPFRASTRIEPDPAVARASVHVETPHGLLVHDMDEALRAIAERITGDLARKEPEA